MSFLIGILVSLAPGLLIASMVIPFGKRNVPAIIYFADELRDALDEVFGE